MLGERMSEVREQAALAAGWLSRAEWDDGHAIH
jgi:5-(carboxyamino)imidazole ribonucleotide synthase